MHSFLLTEVGVGLYCLADFCEVIIHLQNFYLDHMKPKIYLKKQIKLSHHLKHS